MAGGVPDASTTAAGRPPPTADAAAAAAASDADDAPTLRAMLLALWRGGGGGGGDDDKDGGGGGVGPGLAATARLFLLFWLLGLLNNAPYVIMLAGAYELSAAAVGVVYLCAIGPAIAVKLTAPYWFHRVGYAARFWAAGALMAAAFLLVALGRSLAVQLLGVCLVAAQGGVGEASALALCALSARRQQRLSLTAWSSGTGFAGIAGYAWVAVLHRLAGLSFTVTLLIALALPAAWVWVFHALARQQRRLGGGSSSSGCCSGSNGLEGVRSVRFSSGGGGRSGGGGGIGSGGGAKKLSSSGGGGGSRGGTSTPAVGANVLYTRLSAAGDAAGVGAGAAAPTTALLSAPGAPPASSPRRALELSSGGADDVEQQLQQQQQQQQQQGLSRAPHKRGGGGDRKSEAAAAADGGAAAAAAHAAADDDGDGDDDGDAAAAGVAASMTPRQRLRATLALWPYTVPLFVVYFSEYATMSGPWAAIGFPVESKQARGEFYLMAGWMYQAGVFVSRSSGMLWRANRAALWLMPAAQFGFLALFCAIAITHFWYGWSLLAPAFVVGLLGGAVYVQAFTLLAAEVAPPLREFSLAAACVADSLGVAMADVAGVLLQGCLFRAQGLKGASFACGA